MLKCKTGQLVQRMKLNTPVKNGVPGNMWWRGVRKRYPEMTSETRETVNS